MKHMQILLVFALQAYAQTTSTLSVSEDGNCGLDFSQTCQGSRFGDCCSGKGFCGSTVDYCGADCQDGFGTCTSANSTLISSNGNCGATDTEGQFCLGSTFGNCCSEKGFCGSTSDYCGTGCQSEYGNCGTNDGTESTATTSTTSTPSTNSVEANQVSSTVIPATATGSSQETETAAANDTQAASELGTSTAPETEESMSSGAIAGVAVGAVGGVALLVGGMFLVLRRRRQQQPSAELDGGDVGALPPKSAADMSVSGMSSVSGSMSPYERPPVPPPKNTVNVSEMAVVGDPRAELSGEPGTYPRHAGAAAELPAERY